jgi:soluble lytic murein transglycosylase-like protein
LSNETVKKLKTTIKWLIAILIICMLGIVVLFTEYQKIKTNSDTMFKFNKTYIDKLELKNKNLLDQLKEIKIKENNINKLTQFIIYLQPKLEIEIAKLISDKVIEHSTFYGLPPALVISLMYRESSFNTLAVSSAKCVGLMQINPAAHPDKIEDFELEYYDLFMIDHNIKLGCMILHEYYLRDQDIRKALTRYVGGKHETYVSDILAMYANYQIDEFDKIEEKQEEIKEK